MTILFHYSCNNLLLYSVNYSETGSHTLSMILSRQLIVLFTKNSSTSLFSSSPFFCPRFLPSPLFFAAAVCSSTIILHFSYLASPHAILLLIVSSSSFLCGCGSDFLISSPLTQVLQFVLRKFSCVYNNVLGAIQCCLLPP